MSRSVIIIGGGIAGLAAGCYARMNGYEATILEMHSLPGGLCTAWQRGGYTFDGCIHYLLGSAEGQPFSKVWQELGALQGRTMINHQEFMHVRGPEGQTLIVYTDPDRLEQHMRQQWPADGQRIAALCDGVRQLARFDMSLLFERPRCTLSPLGWMQLGLGLLAFVPPLMQWVYKSANDFAAGFRDPFLRRAIPEIFGWPDIPMLAGLSLLAYMSTGNAGFPAGASLEFARSIERRYLELGGRIEYGAQVARILVEHGAGGRARAVGVRLYDDREYGGDFVISAADGRGTIFDMLDGEFMNGGLKRLYDGRMPIISQVQVSLGVNRDMSAEPHWVTYLLDKPLIIAEQEHRRLSIKHYCYDPSLAPEGKSAVEAMLPTKYSYWQRITNHRLYDSEQRQVSGIIIDHLETLYPGIGNDIEVTDEATPLSYERYTGNWQGSSCGWLLTKRTMPAMILGMRKTLPGLENLYLAGQWVEPGGSVPVVAMSGRNAVQLICRKENRPFVTSMP